jgi:ESF2/ABP1 family protein
MDSRFAAAKGWDNDGDSAHSETEGDQSEDEGTTEAQSLLAENTKKKKGKKDSLLREDAKKYKDNLDLRGVIYISRVPPHMKPNKARTLLEGYGEITRLYLAEEDASSRKKRKDRGGNASRQFSEGWVEYSDKKVAKRVAESLNNTPIGGKKGDFYHDDVWNLKYLKNFKWEFLTEKLSYERRVREQKVNAAMMQSKRENAEFTELVEQTKAQKHVEDRKQKRKLDQGGDSGDGGGLKKVRAFRQDRLLGTRDGGANNRVDSSVIGKIFSSNKKA